MNSETKYSKHTEYNSVLKCAILYGVHSSSKKKARWFNFTESMKILFDVFGKRDEYHKIVIIMWFILILKWNHKKDIHSKSQMLAIYICQSLNGVKR